MSKVTLETARKVYRDKLRADEKLRSAHINYIADALDNGCRDWIGKGLDSDIAKDLAERALEAIFESGPE